MNIKDAAQACGLPAKTVRYYEEIGLVSPGRAANGYRAYTEQDVHYLRFVQRSRSLGFTIDECRQLLSLYRDESRASADVKAIALDKIAEVETKIAELESMKTTLTALANSCHGDARQDCPIIDDLAKEPA